MLEYYYCSPHQNSICDGKLCEQQSVYESVHNTVWNNQITKSDIIQRIMSGADNYRLTTARWLKTDSDVNVKNTDCHMHLHGHMAFLVNMCHSLVFKVSTGSTAAIRQDMLLSWQVNPSSPVLEIWLNSVGLRFGFCFPLRLQEIR